MAKLQNHRKAQLQTLRKYPVVVYLDDSEDSQEAKRLLELAGISSIITEGGGGLSGRPLLLWGMGVHQGLDSIKAWLDSEIAED